MINNWNTSITIQGNTGKSLFDGQFIFNKWTVLLNRFYACNPWLNDGCDFMVYNFKQLPVNLFK